MVWTGKGVEHFTTWFQKFELYLEESEKTTKLDHVKCALLLHVAGEEAIEVFNTRSHASREKKNVEDESINSQIARKKPTRRNCYEEDDVNTHLVVDSEGRTGDYNHQWHTVDNEPKTIRSNSPIESWHG